MHNSLKQNKVICYTALGSSIKYRSFISTTIKLNDIGGYAPKCEEYSNNGMTFRWLTDQQDLSIELKFLQTFFYPLIIVVVDVKIFIGG